jgi:hypothetical protein
VPLGRCGSLTSARAKSRLRLHGRKPASSMAASNPAWYGLEKLKIDNANATH